MACFDLVHLRTLSLCRVETPRRLSQRWVRLLVNQLLLLLFEFCICFSFCIEAVEVASHSASTQLTRSLTWRWLSWQGMSLHVTGVPVELIKKIWTCRRIQDWIRYPYSKALFFSSKGFLCAKDRKKISHTSLPWNACLSLFERQCCGTVPFCLGSGSGSQMCYPRFWFRFLPLNFKLFLR
jgi:hypothetical protein